MVNNPLAVFILLFFGSLTPMGANGGDAELPGSYPFKSIKQVVIKETGAWSASEKKPEICSKFILEEGEVRDFFQSAERIRRSLYDYRSTAACYATGEMVFTNGVRASWYIDNQRLGKLTLADGRRAYFYGLKARAPVFAEEGDPHYADPFLGESTNPKLSVKIGPIKSITFRTNPLKWKPSDEQQAGQCRVELSESDVRDFFLHAKFAIRQVLWNLRSNCHVEGDIEFADGRKGSWKIDSSRTGVLEMEDGGRAYLYAKDAKGKGFDTPKK